LSLCCALTGLKDWLIFTQGVALGWYVVALSGLRKKMYTLVDLSEIMDEIRDVMRLHHYSIHTERSYCDWIQPFIYEITR
jgi:hypothetical protein